MNLLKCAFFLICGPFRNERLVSLFCPTNNKALYSCAQCELLLLYINTYSIINRGHFILIYSFFL